MIRNLDNICPIPRLIHPDPCRFPLPSIEHLNIIKILCVPLYSRGGSTKHSQLSIQWSHGVSPPAPRKPRKTHPPPWVEVKEVHRWHVVAVSVDSSGHHHTWPVIQSHFGAGMLTSGGQHGVEGEPLVSGDNQFHGCGLLSYTSHHHHLSPSI